MSTSSSSATSVGIDITTPCPISERATRIVTVLSGAMRTQALTAAGLLAEKAFLKGRETPMTSAPVVLKKSLRVVMSRSLGAGGLVDRRADAWIGAAAAEVALHRGGNVGVARLRVGREQGGGAHDLARLAVAALRHIQLPPGGLHLLARLGRADRLDRGHLLAYRGRDRGAARAHRLAVQMHRARAAQLHAAAEL